MGVAVNLRQVERGEVRLAGELSPGELGVEEVDELIEVGGPVRYDLTAKKLEKSILVQGRLQTSLACECARCLKPFTRQLDLPAWVCHVPLEGEDQAPVMNDCVDLTPFVREDILLEFPQHPLCQADCNGLPEKPDGKIEENGGASQADKGPSDWAELNKLKFN
jgi:uncharacterized metal-binding protein YceD (DUF177 family)